MGKEEPKSLILHRLMLPFCSALASPFLSRTKKEKPSYWCCSELSINRPPNLALCLNVCQSLWWKPTRYQAGTLTRYKPSTSPTHCT
ncbi:hypothetical protein J3F83DRAFT_744066 [Trichoderma novae-zelandiae]